MWLLRNFADSFNEKLRCKDNPTELRNHQADDYVLAKLAGANRLHIIDGAEGTKEAPAKGDEDIVSLSLFLAPMTDLGLTELNQLQGLDLFWTQVTDGGMKELAALSNLTSLRLGSHVAALSVFGCSDLIRKATQTTLAAPATACH